MATLIRKFEASPAKELVEDVLSLGAIFVMVLVVLSF